MLTQTRRSRSPGLPPARDCDGVDQQRSAIQYSDVGFDDRFGLLVDTKLDRPETGS